MDSTEADSVEIKYLKEKIDAGADFVLTQLFYDVDGFLAWEKQCRAMGIVCPIIPGIMPIQSFNGFRRITNLAKIRVPATVAQSLEPIKVKNLHQRIFFFFCLQVRILTQFHQLFRMTIKKSRTMVFSWPPILSNACWMPGSLDFTFAP